MDSRNSTKLSAHHTSENAHDIAQGSCLRNSPFVHLFQSSAEILFNTCTKFYPLPDGSWYPVKRVCFDRQIYNPAKAERLKDEIEKNEFIFGDDDPENNTKLRNKSETFDRYWKKSYNRARQQCFDILMCNPDLDTFLTFTVDPEKCDRFDYKSIVSDLSVWLSNRVRRNGLKYILVPERHKSGAIHFHGIANHGALKLIPSGYYKLGKYTLSKDRISVEKFAAAQEIYNVQDLSLGFSTALLVAGENAQEKISKYIWKYMTKQGGQKIGGRFYLHGGDLVRPKLVFSNDSFLNSDGQTVVYGGVACKIETLWN